MVPSISTARPIVSAGSPFPEIAKKLTIKTGKNAGTSPSVAPSTGPWPKRNSRSRPPNPG